MSTATRLKSVGNCPKLYVITIDEGRNTEIIEAYPAASSETNTPENL